MFVKHRTRSVAGRTYHSYALVETVRTMRGPRHRTICGLGDLPEGVDLRMLSVQLDAAAQGQQTLLGDVDTGVVTEVQSAVAAARPGTAVVVDTDGVSADELRELGPAFVGHTLWRRLGLPEILADAGMPARAQVLTEAMALNRLINPSSEHAMPAWFARTAVGDLLGEEVGSANDNALYRMLDLRHTRRKAIERSLAAQQLVGARVEQPGRGTVFNAHRWRSGQAGSGRRSPSRRAGHL